MTGAAAAAARWAAAWKVGWEALDPDPILACYAADALLSTEPYRVPYRGVAGVREYVTAAFAEEDGPRVWMADPIVEEDRAAVSWWACLREGGVETTLAGTSVLRFGADGLVITQWDTWNRWSGQREPPPGSPFSADANRTDVRRASRAPGS